MMKGSDIGIQEKKAKLFNERERFTSIDMESIESYYHRFLKLMNDFKRNKHFPEKITSNLKFLNNLQPEWSQHVIIVHQTKDLHTADYTQLYDFLKYNQKEDITDPTTAMNMALTLVAKAFKLNYSTPNNNKQRILLNPRNRQIAQPVQNVRNQVVQNAVQNVGNQNGLIVVSRIANQNPNGNADLDQIEKVNANCILMANLQQASTSGTQTDKALVFDSDISAEVHNYDNCYDNEIFNMFTQEEQYTELLEPIPEPHQVPQNDNNVISEVSSMEQSGGTVEQHPANVEETRVLYDSLYNNLAIEVKKVNTVNRKLRETNAELTTELARYKTQEKCFEISHEKYDKLERCYQKSVYQEQCLTKKINALHLSSADESLAKHKALELEIQRLLRAMASKQKDTTRGTSANTKFAKQSILGKPPSSFRPKLYVVTPLPKSTIFPKVGETHALSKPVTSNSIPTPQESKVVKNNKVIAPGIFRINSFKPFREEKYVPNKVKASVRTNPITVSQPPVITKKVVNSDSNGLSSTGVDNTVKTRKPQPRSNTKNDRVPFASKSSCSKNKEVEVEEHLRNLLLSKNKKHMSSECNNVKLATRNVKSKLVCAMCKKCLISINHDVCLLNYVNDMNFRGKKQKENVSINKNQKKL
nr:hypothetical protein [Tanacetum cinerariifolium]